jgi:hypothetical protein
MASHISLKPVVTLGCESASGSKSKPLLEAPKTIIETGDFFSVGKPSGKKTVVVTSGLGSSDSKVDSAGQSILKTGNGKK